MTKSSKEYWLEFFDENPKADELADNIRFVGAQSKFSRPDWPLLLTPIMYTQSFVTEQANNLSELFKLIRQLPVKLFDGELIDFANAIGFTHAELHTLYKKQASNIGLYPCRWDIIHSSEGWKVLEVNVGGALGGFASDAIHALYDDTIAQATSNDPLLKLSESWQSQYSHISRQIKKTLEQLDNPILVVVDDEKMFSDSPLIANSVANALAEKLNIEVKSVPHTDLQSICSQHEGQVLVFEIFGYNDVINSGISSYQAYFEGLVSNKIESTISPLSELFMSKAILALLKEARHGDLLNDSEITLIDSLIPETYLVTQDTLARLESLDHSQWVLKAAVGYGGNNVTCGWETDLNSWSAQLEAAAQTDTPLHIVQKRVIGIRESTISITPSGLYVECDQPIVLGIFMFEDEFGGGVIRQSLTGSGITSSTNQASVGVMRVAQA